MDHPYPVLQLIFIYGEAMRAMDRLEKEVEMASDGSVKSLAKWAKDHEFWDLYVHARKELSSRLQEKVERDLQ